jgi:ubiquitin C-terminal hydrolase
MANYYPQYNPNYRQQPQVPSDMPLGLANLGNTCYINSILQVLFQIFNFPMSSNMGPLTQLYVQLRQSHSYVTNTEFKK